jgi:hypothetical protein
MLETMQRRETAPQDIAHVGRRGLLSLAAVVYAAAMPMDPVNADEGSIAPVQELNAALLAAMKAGASISFARHGT